MTASRSKPDADDRLRRYLATFLALLLNLTFLVALDRVMRPLARERAHWPRATPDDVLQVRLIEPSPPSPSPQAPEPAREPAAPERPRPHASARTEPRALPPPVAAGPVREQAAARAPSDSAESRALPQFYGRDGQVRIPEAGVEPVEMPFPQLPIVPAEGNPFVHRNPLPYEPTRFDRYFPDVRETLGGELVRKATVKRGGRLPGGLYVECTWVLFFGGCAWGHPPTAPIEELKAMRADPPMPKTPPAPPSPTLDLSLKPPPLLDPSPAPVPDSDPVPEPPL